MSRRLASRLAAWLAAAVVGGCAFELPDKEVEANGCGDTGDCGTFEVCSPVTATCELSPPATAPFTVEGPFVASTNALVPSGSAFTAAWDSYESNGYGIPGGFAVLNHFIAIEATPESPVVSIAARGPRHVSRLSDGVGFYYLVMQVDRDAYYRPGDHPDVITLAGSLLFCESGYMPPEGWPPDDVNVSWDGPATLQCWQLFTVTQGSILLLETGYGGAPTRGYLRFRLDPSVFPPD